MNFAYVFAQGNIVVLATLILLLAMSIASWYVIFWKTLTIKKERAQLDRFRAEHMKTPDWPVHFKPANVKGSVAILLAESEKLEPVLAKYSQNDRNQILAMHLVQSLDLIRAWLDKGLTLLASIGSSAPFIGLFGTVWGIYGALTQIAAQGNAGLNVVAGPMGEALVATAVGLFAAIPAVLAYNSFVRLNRLLVQDLRHIAEQMTVYLSVNTLPHSAENVKVMGKR